MKRNTRLLAATLVAGTMIALGSPPQGAGAEKKKKGPKLVTSSVELEPVLIGKAAKTEKEWKAPASQDGALNVVIDSPYQIWGEMGTYIHLAIFDPKFKPAKGAEVYMDRKLVGTADATGTFVFSIAPNRTPGYANTHNLDIVLEKGGKTYYGSTYFNAYPRTQGFESASVFVYTDRGVYNPGQVIRIRAIAWKLRDDFEPLQNRSLDLLLTNESGRVVAGGAVETDQWGVATFDVPLPEHAPEGRYTLEATFERETARAKLRIERFVPPVIDIQHDLGRFLTRDTKTLPVEITLGMFGGGKFTKGDLKLTVEARGQVRFEKEMEVAGKGPHVVTIGEKALEKIMAGLGEDENVRVTIEVVDEFGRSDEIKRDMRFTANPYRVVVEMDKDQYAEGDKVKAMVRIVDLDEVPIRDKKVKLVVDGKDLWEKTDESGIAKFQFPMGKNTIYGQVYIEGVDQSLATAYAYYHPPRPMTSEIPEGVVKERQETDIVVRFPTDYVPAEKVVHADIVDSSGALIGAVLIPVSKEKDGWVARGSFPAPTWGSMLLTLFAVGRKGKDDVGLLTEGMNLPVVADRELEVTLKGLPDEAKPGQKLAVSALVTDKDGQPVDASVGASIVDQAVIGMLDPLEITPMDKFYNPQLKVLSTTGSKILTWPVVSRNWGYPLYDIALPPFGFRSGGKNVNQPAVSSASKNYDKKSSGKPKKGKPKKSKKSSKTKSADLDDAFGNGGLGLSGKGAGGGGMAEGSYGIGSASFSSTLAGAAAPDEAEAMPAMDMPMAAMAEETGAMDASISSLLGPASTSMQMGAATPTGKDAKVQVVVRTNFAETSLWQPGLVAEDGKLAFDAVLPDSITTQTVTLVASDGEGRVGMLREKVDVSQDLYARSDLPAVLALGDEVEVTSAVRNFSGKAVQATLGIESSGLDVVGPSQQKVNVPDGGTAAVAFTVRPKSAGDVEYEVWVQAAGIKDVERRTLFVSPVGLPTVIRAKGDLSRDDPFVANVHVSGEDAHMTAFLGVSFPGAVPVVQGLESMVDQPGGLIDYFSSNALVTAMAYRYLLMYGKNEDVLENLRLRLQASMTALLMAQNPDGGWGWHVATLRVESSGQMGVDVPWSNPYMTAQTLEGLVEMKRAGIPVPEDNVRQALYSLANTLGSDNLWSVDAIAFWEGKTQEVQLGVSAEIFRVMVDACDVYPSLISDHTISQAVDRLFVQFQPVLGDPMMRDPLALSHASLGVWKWAKLTGKVNKDLEADLGVAANRLVTLRDEAYWEPSWFSAFGGTLEATAASMELLHELDPEEFESELRRSLQYVLSTQESFGAWHNARGTAAAVRALLLFPPTAKEIPSEVKVLVDGKVVARVEIDPDDPFMSAVALRQLEITGHLSKGDNQVKVVYDGKLKAPVKLTVHKWSKPEKKSMAVPGAPAITVGREVADVSDGAGRLFAVDIVVDFEKDSVPVMVTEPIPSNAGVDVTSLDALIAKGVILGYDLESDRVVFYPTPGEGDLHIVYRLEGERRGKAIHAGTTVAPLSDPDLAVCGKPGRLVVD